MIGGVFCMTSFEELFTCLGRCASVLVSTKSCDESVPCVSSGIKCKGGFRAANSHKYST